MLRSLPILAVSLLSAGAVSLLAQTDDGKPRPEGGRPPGPRMVPPLLKALDADGDFELSAEEIANASKALLTLDKNGDGKLSGEELRPPRPEGQRPPGPRDGERGPRRGPRDNPEGKSETGRPPRDGGGANN